MDDNEDGFLSPEEQNRHRAEVMMQGRAGFKLASQEKKIALKGFLLNLSEPHGSWTFSLTPQSPEVEPVGRGVMLRIRY